MQPHRRRRRLEGGHALRQQAAGEPGEHVAGAGGGERRRQIEADRRATVGRGDDRVGALEDDDRAERRGGGAGSREFRWLIKHFGAAAEQPGELAFVRRDDRRAALARRSAPPVRAASPAKLVSASASRTIARGSALGSVRAAATRPRVASPTPAPGPISAALRRGSASSRAKPARPAKGATITAVECAALAATASGGLAMVASPAPTRSAARAASRAAPVRWAGPETTSAAPRVYLWAKASSRGAASRQIAGALTKALGAIAASARLAEADVGEDETAAQRASRQQQVARLEAEERDAGARLDRRAAHPSGRAVDAGGRVDAEHRPARAREGVDRLDAAERRAVDVARQAGAVQRVDDEVGVVERESFAGANRPAPARRRQSRIAAHPRAIAEQRELDPIAPGFEQPRGDEAVAAVAARPAQNGDPAAARRHARRLGGDRRAGALHQRDARRSCGDGQPVGLGHLGRSQQFGTTARIEHGAIVAPRPKRGKARRRRRENWRFPSRDFLLYRAGVPA